MSENYIKELTRYAVDIMDTAFPNEEREVKLLCSVTSGEGSYTIKAERHKDGSSDVTITDRQKKMGTVQKPAKPNDTRYSTLSKSAITV